MTVQQGLCFIAPICHHHCIPDISALQRMLHAHATSQTKQYISWMEGEAVEAAAKKAAERQRARRRRQRRQRPRHPIERDRRMARTPTHTCCSVWSFSNG